MRHLFHARHPRATLHDDGRPRSSGQTGSLSETALVRLASYRHSYGTRDGDEIDVL